MYRRMAKFTGWAIIEELWISRWVRTILISGGQKTYVKHCCADWSSWHEVWFAITRLGNYVTDFMISDESGNRFFLTAGTDYWQDRAVIAYQQADFSRVFPVFTHIFLSIKNDCHSSMSSQKLHNMPIWLRIISISSIHDLFHKQVHGRCVL